MLLTLTLTKPQLLGMLAGNGLEGIQTNGDPGALHQLLGLLDTPIPGSRSSHPDGAARMAAQEGAVQVMHPARRKCTQNTCGGYSEDEVPACHPLRRDQPHRRGDEPTRAFIRRATARQVISGCAESDTSRSLAAGLVRSREVCRSASGSRSPVEGEGADGGGDRDAKLTRIRQDAGTTDASATVAAAHRPDF